MKRNNGNARADDAKKHQVGQQLAPILLLPLELLAVLLEMTLWLPIPFPPNMLFAAIKFRTESDFKRSKNCKWPIVGSKAFWHCLGFMSTCKKLRLGLLELVVRLDIRSAKYCSKFPWLPDCAPGALRTPFPNFNLFGKLTELKFKFAHADLCNSELCTFWFDAFSQVPGLRKLAVYSQCPCSDRGISCRHGFMCGNMRGLRSFSSDFGCPAPLFPELWLAQPLNRLESLSIVGCVDLRLCQILPSFTNLKSLRLASWYHQMWRGSLDPDYFSAFTKLEVLKTPRWNVLGLCDGDLKHLVQLKNLNISSVGPQLKIRHGVGNLSIDLGSLIMLTNLTKLNLQYAWTNPGECARNLPKLVFLKKLSLKHHEERTDSNCHPIRISTGACFFPRTLTNLDARTVKIHDGELFKSLEYCPELRKLKINQRGPSEGEDCSIWRGLTFPVPHWDDLHASLQVLEKLQKIQFTISNPVSPWFLYSLCRVLEGSKSLKIVDIKLKNCVEDLITMSQSFLQKHLNLYHCRAVVRRQRGGEERFFTKDINKWKEEEKEIEREKTKDERSYIH